MRKGLGTFACAAAVVLLVGLTPAGAASNTSAKQWANGVCSAVQAFGDSIQSTLSGLKDSASLDAASQDLQSGLDDATQQLDESLQKLGKPPTSDGAKARSAVQNLSKELKSDVSDIEDLLSPPPSTPQETASTFSAIGGEVEHAVSQVQSTATTLKGLKPNGTLQKAFQNSSQCQELKKSL
jgi:hypothetical protein